MVRAAIAVMRPNWPPPRMARSPPGLIFSAFGSETGLNQAAPRPESAQVSAPALPPCAPLSTPPAARKAPRRFPPESQPPAAPRWLRRPCQLLKSHRNTLRHLHNREQGIEAVQLRGRHRHAQHRNQRLRRQHARQVRRAARTGNDRAQSPRRAVSAYSNSQSGVRCALTIRDSCGIPSARKISTAAESTS